MKVVLLRSMLCVSSLLVPDASIFAQVPSTTSSPLAAHGAPNPSTLLDGTPVKLRLAQTISSADAKTGQEVSFEVVEDVKVQDLVVIAKGSNAIATVTEADHKKSMGRGGKLNLNIDSVRLIDNEKAALRATAGGKGGGHTGAMTGAIVATSILFFPAAPLFLFIHGKDITLAKGMETTAFIEGDMALNIQAFAPANAPSLNASPLSTQVSVEANVANCDIDVDGVFSGSTPSKISMAPGKHEIAVHKKNYGEWTRTLMVSGTEVHLYAELTMEGAPAAAIPPQ